MEFIHEILSYLETNGVGEIGTDLFRGTLPDEPDNCIMVIATGGEAPSTYLPIRTRSIQITTRGASYEWAEDKIKDIYYFLHHLGDEASFVLSGGSDIMDVRAMQEPTNIGKDESNRSIFTCNFLIKTRV